MRILPRDLNLPFSAKNLKFSNIIAGLANKISISINKYRSRCHERLLASSAVQCSHNYQYIIHSLLGPLCIRINSNEYSAQIFSVFFLLVALSQGSEMLFRYLKMF